VKDDELIQRVPSATPWSIPFSRGSRTVSLRPNMHLPLHLLRGADRYMREYTDNDASKMRADITNLVNAALDGDTGEVWTANTSTADQEEVSDLPIFHAAALWFKPGMKPTEECAARRATDEG
jgi:hypothetical protein